jgi:HAD superfamily hydrolase (TIGR01549 family)
MKNFEGIIFDVDGTLTSTNNLIFESFRFVAKKYLNKKPTNEEIASLFGPPEDVILKEMSEDKFEEIKKDYYDFYYNNHHLADLYPGIKELLQLIKDGGIHLAIFTGKGRKAAVITLEKLKIINYFDSIITGDDVKKHKPSAEGIIKFINEFNLDKEKVLMIGDSTGDIKASREAGIKVASVLWDSLTKDKVLKLGSDFVFFTVEELKNFISDNI